MCVHGLSRQGRDFDTLAQQLMGEYRVICPDVVGRGESDWLEDPEHYGLQQYAADMVALLARLNVAQVDWVGTSMGGLIGLILAALPDSPVRRLVLNDVGPALEWSALQRIATYIGREMHFPSAAVATAHLREISPGFGAYSEADWTTRSAPMLRATPDGVRLHYDPGIGLALRALTPETAMESELFLWAAYESLRQPVLLLRGEQSDLLRPETAQRMALTGPKAQWVNLPEVGHASLLDRSTHFGPVLEFLRQP
ncbi:alpha/beta fold hydrolase [Inhella gelatinilytica]|nr:alpha/beta hydrolase [Inhella gelatinilytica]